MAAAPSLPPQLFGDPLSRASLYVGDLHPDVTELELRQTFHAIGPLHSIRICKDRVPPHKSLGYAYVNFLYPSHASMALAYLNHAELKGNPMRIMWSQRDPITRKSGIANLFVKNLDPSVSSARLHEIFGKFGTILSCKVADEHGKSKSFGFVQFDLEESATNALHNLHGTMIEGKKLYVSKFVKKSERKGACEEPNFTNLYVKNLDKELTGDLLLNKFSEYGKVYNAVIMKDFDGKSKGFGFVSFESHEEAKKAMEAMNGALFGSKNLFVGKAQKKAEREEILRCAQGENCQAAIFKASNLYVKNLSASIDDKSLEELFSDFGNVTAAKVMCYNTGNSKGFGFVSFSTPEEAKKALDSLDGCVVHGMSLYVAVAQDRKERQRELKQRRSFHTFKLDIHAPQFYPLNYSFPIAPTQFPVSHMNLCWPNMYQHPHKNVDVLHSFGAETYQQNLPQYFMLPGNMQLQIPMKQPQQGIAKGLFYNQRSMSYAASNGREQHGARKNLKQSWKKNRTSSKGPSSTRELITGTASSRGNGRKNIHHPVVENHQARNVNKSNMQNTSNCLAAHSANAVQLKAASMETGLHGTTWSTF